MANYTQKAIMQTFEAMLSATPIEKITVSSIVAECEISSNTFYYHFRDIYDLLDKWLAEKNSALMLQVSQSEDFSSYLKALLHTMQAHPQIVYHVFNSISRERLERYIFTSVESHFLAYVTSCAADTSLARDTLADISAFCCYSILGFVLKFIWMHMQADVDSEVDRLTEIFGGLPDYAILCAKRKEKATADTQDNEKPA